MNVIYYKIYKQKKKYEQIRLNYEANMAKYVLFIKLQL